MRELSDPLPALCHHQDLWSPRVSSDLVVTSESEGESNIGEEGEGQEVRRARPGFEEHSLYVADRSELLTEDGEAQDDGAKEEREDEGLEDGAGGSEPGEEEEDAEQAGRDRAEGEKGVLSEGRRGMGRHAEREGVEVERRRQERASVG